jgi:hypothetical protein
MQIWRDTVSIGRGERCLGRLAIVTVLKKALAEGGVLELMQGNLSAGKYTGLGDSFQFDFGYKTGSAVKVFHAVSIAWNYDRALLMALNYRHIANVMATEQLDLFLTAIIGEKREEKTAQSIMGLLTRIGVRVRPLRDIPGIVGEVQQDKTLGLSEQLDLSGPRGRSHRHEGMRFSKEVDFLLPPTISS